MLKSQFDALQEPGADEPDVQVVDIRPSLENVIENTCSTIRKIVAGDN